MIKYRVEIDDNGNIFWHKWETIKLHREDGPAIEWNDGSKWWYLNGKLHREDGPACEDVSGAKSWYLNDKRLSEEEWKAKVSTTDCEGKIVEIDGIEYELRRKQ